MTFTSIPPSLKPVVEDVAMALRDALHGEDAAEYASRDWEPDAEAAILAFLNACVERGVGRAATGALAAEGAFVAVELREGEYVNKGSFPAVILNLKSAKETKE